MRVFKFGGASVKDATSIKNVKTVLETTGFENLVVIVSAMGKMTNALEKVVSDYLNKSSELHASLAFVTDYHYQILQELFPEKSNPVYAEIKILFEELNSFFELNKSTSHAYVYDQVVCFGELIATKIVSQYLNQHKIQNSWLDSRECIKTDSNYRDAGVDWNQTQSQIKDRVNNKSLTVTQGFLGSNENNFTTTLGREGSDYTAAIFAYSLGAESVTIWKDVPGVLNADPRVFENTELLRKISYKEAIEMAFYGASVIHPKTLQPLQRKEIPLFVKSFLNPVEQGTCVSKGKDLEPSVSCYIVKKEQVLLSLSSLDFSFMMEDNIGEVFKYLYEFKMKVNLIQNSAISFTVVVDNKYKKLEELISKLKSNFKVRFNENVTLFTIRHFRERDVFEIEKSYQVLLKQQSRDTVQLVVK